MAKAKRHFPPDHLSDRAKALWRSVVAGRSKSPERLALVQTALESLDRADAAREAVASEGMTAKTESTGAIHVHPLVKVERESRQQFARIWFELGFDADPTKPPSWAEALAKMSQPRIEDQE